MKLDSIRPHSTHLFTALYHHLVSRWQTDTAGDKVAPRTYWVATLILPLSIAVAYPLFGPLLVIVFAGWLERSSLLQWLVLIVVLLAGNLFGNLGLSGLPV